MAVTRQGNVIKLTADNDTVAGPLRVERIRVLGGGTTPAVLLKQTDTNGFIYFETGTLANDAIVDYNETCFRVPYGETLHCDMTGSNSTVYIYIK